MQTIIKNALVFNGTQIEGIHDVSFQDDFITDSFIPDSNTQIIDGTGCTLLPGLIDSHIHLNSINNLKQAAQYGVTTMLDMMTDDAAL